MSQQSIVPEKDLIVKTPWYALIPSRKIRESVRLILKRSRTVLDIGTGNGGALRLFLNENPLLKATAIDVSQTGVDLAMENLKPFVKYLVLDVEQQTPRDKHDFVWSYMLLGKIEDPVRFLEFVRKSMRKDGLCCITAVSKEKWAWYWFRNRKWERALHPDHVNEYLGYFRLLLECWKAGLEIIQMDQVAIQYPLVDPCFKLFKRWSRVRWVFDLANSKFVQWIRKISLIPIPGYYTLAVICRRKRDEK